MKTLYRYISLELLKTATTAFFLFLFVILINRASQIAETILGQGVSFLDFFSILLKMLPAFFGIVIPIALIISITMVLLSMESNNEITALKSCGVSVKQISVPVIILGVVASAISFYSTMYLAPKSNVEVKRDIERLVKKKLTMSITPKNFSSNFPGITFYVEKIFPQKGIIEDFMVSIQKKDKLITIFGKEGNLRTENDTVFLDILNGSAQILNWKKPKDFQFLTFKNYTVELFKFSSEERFNARKYQTLSQLLKEKNVESQTEILKRLCLSLSPLIVGILIFSIAVSLPRGAFGTGISLTLLTIVIYYVLYTFSKRLAFGLKLPEIALLPDILFGALSGLLYYLSIKEKLKIHTGARW